MKQPINIRSDQTKPKIGNYQEVRNQVNQRLLDKDSRRKSINSSTDPTKKVTTKPLKDQK